jgi:sulfonate transport system permease protein
MAMVKPGIAVRGRTRDGAGVRRPRSAPSLRALRGLIVPALLLVLWQVVVARGTYSRGQLASPLNVVAAARELATAGLLVPNLVASLQRVFLGFALGGGIAVLLGLIVGGSRTVEALLGPTLQAIRAIPSLAWVPLLLLWLGFGELPKIILVAIGVFFPVYANLVGGIRQIDRKLIEVGRAYGLDGVHLAREVMLPAALPSLLTGLRLGLAQGWLFLVAAELLGAFTGLGFLLIDAQNTGRVDIILLCILLLALLGKLSDSLLHLLERRLLRWTDTFRGGT